MLIFRNGYSPPLGGIPGPFNFKKSLAHQDWTSYFKQGSNWWANIQSYPLQNSSIQKDVKLDRVSFAYSSYLPKILLLSCCYAISTTMWSIHDIEPRMIHAQASSLKEKNKRSKTAHYHPTIQYHALEGTRSRPYTEAVTTHWNSPKGLNFAKPITEPTPKQRTLLIHQAKLFRSLN